MTLTATEEIREMISFWRNKAAEMNNTVEFKIFYPTKNLITWICNELKIEKQTEELAVNLLENYIKSGFHLYKYNIPSLAAACINISSSYSDHYISSELLMNTVKVGRTNLREHISRLNDINEFEGLKCGLNGG